MPNPQTELLAKINAEVNGIFAKMGEEVEKQVKQGAVELDVLKIARVAGLQIDEAMIDDLQVDRIIFPHPWLPWHIWYPWKPFWCWWWRRYHPWYRCCHWWWHRCHWHNHHH